MPTVACYLTTHLRVHDARSYVDTCTRMVLRLHHETWRISVVHAIATYLLTSRRLIHNVLTFAADTFNRLISASSASTLTPRLPDIRYIYAALRKWQHSSLTRTLLHNNGTPCDFACRPVNFHPISVVDSASHYVISL